MFLFSIVACSAVLTSNSTCAVPFWIHVCDLNTENWNCPFPWSPIWFTKSFQEVTGLPSRKSSNVRRCPGPTPAFSNRMAPTSGLIVCEICRCGWTERRLWMRLLRNSETVRKSADTATIRLAILNVFCQRASLNFCHFVIRSLSERVGFCVAMIRCVVYIGRPNFWLYGIISA